MTICTEHRYGGPQACPYCENARLQLEVRALKLALETMLVNQGAGTSPYARSQPSDACEIELWKGHAECAWEDLEAVRRERDDWHKLADDRARELCGIAPQTRMGEL